MTTYTPAITDRQKYAMATLAAIGAIFGQAIGIAALGTAIAGTLPLMLLGLILGRLLF